jgi:iron complex outermembrane receptor protein
MLIRILTLFIAVIHFNYLSAQEGILKGKVTDSKTKEVLGGVSVYIDKMGATTSNADGTYEVKALAGNHELEFKFIGYSTTLWTILIKEGETVVLDISLEVAATELGVMVVSAGKFEQKLDEVTVSMEVLKPALIDNKNTISVDNILEQIPGVNVLDGQANIRGGSGFSYGAGSRVMVLVDDLPILTADAGDAKWDFIPVENIEQVEVIKGASSALFGSSAMNGVINFRTSYPKDSARTSVSISTGIYDRPKRDELVWWGKSNPTYSKTSFFHSEQIKNFDLTIGANSFLDEGYRKLETDNRNRFNFGTRYRFQKLKGLSAGLNGNFMDARGGYFILWQNADSAYYPQGGSVSDFHTKRLMLDPFITYFSPNGNRHSLRTRFYQAVNTNNTNQESVSDVWYAEYQYQLHLKKDLNITSGVTSTYSEVHSDSLYGNHYSSNVGFFSQADKKFNRLIFSVGVRGEYFKVDTAETKYKIIMGKDTSVLPIHPVFRAGLNYKLFAHTHLRASFGQGYRFPSVAEKFIQTKVSGLTIYPNPEIQPETGWSAEIAVKQAFKIGGLKGFLDVAGFWQEYRNMMEFTFGYWVPPGTPNPTSPFTMLTHFGAKSVNVGRAQIKGAELTAAGEGKIGKIDLTVLGGYTYIVPIDLDFDSATSGGTYNANILKYRYQHTAKMDIQADHKKWSTGISLRYNSFMKNIDASFQKELFNDLFPTLHSNVYILPGLKEYREQHNKGDIILDYRISFEIKRELKFFAVINNIFNREYMGRPGDVQPPRTFAFGVSARI